MSVDYNDLVVQKMMTVDPTFLLSFVKSMNFFGDSIMCYVLIRVAYLSISSVFGSLDDLLFLC